MASAPTPASFRLIIGTGFVRSVALGFRTQKTDRSVGPAIIMAGLGDPQGLSMMRTAGLCTFLWSIVSVMAFAQPAAAPDVRVVNAARAQDVAAVRVLVGQRADVNAAQGDGATALHWAAHWNQLDMVRLLLGAGANVNAADDHGVTPLALAATNGNTGIIDLLLQAGANSNARLETGETPFMRAVRTGKLDAVSRMLAGGADVNAAEKWRNQ